MRLIDPYADSNKYKKIIQSYGGEYSFFEKLKIGGVGSPKLNYISGIAEFDEIKNQDSLEISSSNIELLKAGLIIRINKRQKLAVAILHLQELEAIHFRKVENSSEQNPQALLTVQPKADPPVTFTVGPEEYLGMKKYLEKKILKRFT